MAQRHIGNIIEKEEVQSFGDVSALIGATDGDIEEPILKRTSEGVGALDIDDGHKEEGRLGKPGEKE